MTRGAVGPHFLFPQVLDDLDLLKQHEVRVQIGCVQSHIEGQVNCTNCAMSEVIS